MKRNFVYFCRVIKVMLMFAALLPTYNIHLTHAMKQSSLANGRQYLYDKYSTQHRVLLLMAIDNPPQQWRGDTKKGFKKHGVSGLLLLGSSGATAHINR
jgi:hypothetical protein